nr:MAG TPA: hypothetical protein [Caudoviricetes sp.]
MICFSVVLNFMLFSPLPYWLFTYYIYIITHICNK